MQSNLCSQLHSYLHADSLTMLRFLTLQPMGSCYFEEMNASITDYLNEPLDRVLNTLESSECIRFEDSRIALTDYGLDYVEMNN
ncbi:hypothetical protein AB4402_11565 [Vibrio breoganii]|uniref:hypothetical protein n=1 Tax=Vibrio breoganii TaxID=553239 RepID=UPI000C840048|nr:hypothetical protein [Vibrio breoganii]PMF84611.1 hypothetical protein BCV08_01710 [Vibrio breoganii]PML83684.1 hypothetical protein BCT68_09480 [Vibrio breoganii]PMM22031.1 hypothetical protein BCT59_05345 [Vibrio breoganii]PMO73104.1 hypothetical protein BCT02_01650 [Vibrio breoganii]PMO84728.1 hypothetical protein BCS99_15895 [Vibrio breoganii]